jgi:hypothetical protein
VEVCGDDSILDAVMYSWYELTKGNRKMAADIGNVK